MPRVHEYELLAADQPLVDIYGAVNALGSPVACVVLVLVGVALVALLHQRKRQERGTSKASAIAALMMPAVLLGAVFAVTWGLIDEVSINLEHAYNLHHHGRFSFSPVALVDGTVEYVYYLLLSPFAWTPVSLVIASFVAGLVIAVAHLLILTHILRRVPVPLRLALLLLFSVNYPIVAQLSNGFGNSLVSLLLLCALSLFFDGSGTAARGLAAALPLLRPDAVLYSYALLFAFGRETKPAPTWRRFGTWAAPAAALAGYLIVHRSVYGHWIPTPVAFKSVSPAMLPLFRPSEFVARLLAGVSEPPQIIGLIAFAASFRVAADTRLSTVRRLAVATAGIYLFYTFTRSILEDFSSTAYARYWLGFDLALFLCTCLMVVHASEQRIWRLLPPPVAARVWRVAPSLLMLVTFAGIAGLPGGGRNRTDLAFAGQLADRIIPRGLSIATSELNTFGLMFHDREVIDLWGYTAPAIAGARLLNGERIRNNPDWFRAVRPDIYWAFLPGDASDIEEYVATFLHLRKSGNLLGDLRQVLSEYDVVLVAHPARQLTFLTHRSAVPAFHQSLQSRGYRLRNRRDFDLPRFKALYDPQELVQYRF